MIMMLLCAGVFLAVVLVVNRILSNWQADTIKGFRQEEKVLRESLTVVVKEQKLLLVELREIKNDIVNAERMIEDAQMDGTEGEAGKSS